MRIYPRLVKMTQQNNTTRRAINYFYNFLFLLKLLNGIKFNNLLIFNKLFFYIKYLNQQVTIIFDYLEIMKFYNKPYQKKAQNVSIEPIIKNNYHYHRRKNINP